MKKLNANNFERAKRFLLSQGRLLDQKLFKFYFEDGSSDAVLDELMKYQNTDGGFGNSLEPDLRTPLSSALATSIALKVMVKMGVKSENEILKKTVSYLLETLDRENWRWPIAPEGRKDSPHAPWWGAEDIITSFRGCIANPSSELTGQLLSYQELVTEEVMESLLNKMKNYLVEATGEGGSFEMHDLICYLELYHSNGLDNSTRESFKPILISAEERIVEKDKNKWNEYVTRPLWVCDNPNSVLFPNLKDSVYENLQFDIESQNEDGSWSPFWSWGDYNAEDWPIAKKEWSSHLTLKTLLTFKNFDCIEEDD